MLVWQDLRPGFYRGTLDRSVGMRVDKVHGHYFGAPIINVAWLDASPLGWRVSSVGYWEILSAAMWAFEPMDPPR